MVANAKHQQQTMDITYGLFFPHFEIFPTKIVKNMILRNTMVSISEKEIDCVLLYVKTSREILTFSRRRLAESCPRRDQEGKNTSLGFVCAWLVMEIYFRQPNLVPRGRDPFGQRRGSGPIFPAHDKRDPWGEVELVPSSYPKVPNK